MIRGILKYYHDYEARVSDAFLKFLNFAREALARGHENDILVRARTSDAPTTENLHCCSLNSSTNRQPPSYTGRAAAESVRRRERRSPETRKRGRAVRDQNVEMARALEIVPRILAIPLAAPVTSGSKHCGYCPPDPALVDPEKVLVDKIGVKRDEQTR